MPVLKLVKSTYTPSSKDIKLSYLSGVSGVNRLASGQTISFSDNLTVVYGCSVLEVRLK